MPRSVPEIARLVSQGMPALETAPFAADAVYELPFQSERFEGREAVLAALAAGPDTEKAPITVTLSETGFVLESPSAVGVLTVVAGEITSYRHYRRASASPARAVFDAFLAASVENRWDDLADLYAPDVVIEMPFTPAGVPRLTRGREELRSRFLAAGKVRRLVKADNVVVHETSDPSVLVAEFDLHGELGGSAFVSTYVLVMTVRDGLITYSRDYADTAAAAERIRQLRASSPAGSSAE
jgi:ketosteroid isomerase-like protein